MKKYNENQQGDVHDTSIFFESIKEKITYRKGETLNLEKMKNSEARREL